MKILVTGATGLVGKKLCIQLLKNGHEVNVLTRSVSSVKKRLPLPVSAFEWKKTDTKKPPQEAFEGVDAIIHLMGETIASKWTDKVKARIYKSRVDSTKLIVKAINSYKNHNVKAFISTSAVGFYGDRGDEVLSESSKPGSGFLADVCIDWEEALEDLNQNVRLCVVRVGVVIDKAAHFINEIAMPLKNKVLGPLAGGANYVSWVHLEDLVNIYVTALENKKYKGIYNGTAPEPLTNKEMTQVLCEKAGYRPRPSVPKFALKLLLGEMSTMALASMNAKPMRLLEEGFTFKYSTFSEAIDQVYSRSVYEEYYEAILWLEKPIDEMAKFFSDPYNLEKITPPWLNFKVTNMSTPEIKENTLIDYKLKLKGIPLSWQTRILNWDLPSHFVDNQDKGPYDVWHHKHTFESVAGGTLMTDQVHYKVPVGQLGALAANWYVKGDVSKIFNYRTEAIQKL